MIEIPAYLRPRTPAIAAALPALPAANNDTGRLVWCGPVAVSALTGAPASAIEAAVRAHRATRPRPAADILAERRRAKRESGDGDAIVGTSALDLRPVLAGYGWHLGEPWAAPESTTFGAWLQRPRSAAPRLVGLMYRRAPHWVALRGVMTADTASAGRWIFAVDGPHLRARMLDVYELARIGEGAR